MGKEMRRFQIIYHPLLARNPFARWVRSRKGGLGSLCAAPRHRAGLLGAQDLCKLRTAPGLDWAGCFHLFPYWAGHCPSPSGHQYGVAGPVASRCPCPKPLTFEILLCLVARPAFIPRVLGVKVRSVS